MKKAFIILIFIIMTLGSSYAHEFPTTRVELNGDLVGGNNMPFIIEGRTMVPIRWISDNLGKNTEWHEETSTLYIGSDSIKDWMIQNIENIENVENSKFKGFSIPRVFIDDHRIKTEVPPIIVGGVIYVPLRRFSEITEMDIHWDNERKIVVIDEASMKPLDEIKIMDMSGKYISLRNIAYNDITILESVTEENKESFRVEIDNDTKTKNDQNIVYKIKTNAFEYEMDKTGDSHTIKNPIAINKMITFPKSNISVIFDFLYEKLELEDVTIDSELHQYEAQFIGKFKKVKVYFRIHDFLKLGDEENNSLSITIDISENSKF